VTGLLAGTDRPAASETLQPRRAVPGDYVIPSPGEDFTVTETVDDQRLVCRWFTSAEQELMVQIAYKLPLEITGAEGTEIIDLNGRVAAVYLEQGEQKLVELRDGEILLQIEYYNADKEEVLAYAAALAEANGIG
jgi:hypothetical protein